MSMQLNFLRPARVTADTYQDGRFVTLDIRGEDDSRVSLFFGLGVGDEDVLLELIARASIAAHELAAMREAQAAVA